MATRIRYEVDFDVRVWLEDVDNFNRIREIAYNIFEDDDGLSTHGEHITDYGNVYIHALDEGLTDSIVNKLTKKTKNGQQIIFHLTGADYVGEKHITIRHGAREVNIDLVERSIEFDCTDRVSESPFIYYLFKKLNKSLEKSMGGVGT